MTIKKVLISYWIVKLDQTLNVSKSRWRMFTQNFKRDEKYLSRNIKTNISHPKKMKFLNFLAEISEYIIDANLAMNKESFKKTKEW